MVSVLGLHVIQCCADYCCEIYLCVIHCHCSKENEGKLMLWWAKVVELVIRHLHFGGNPQFVVRWLNTFIPALFGLAEDKSSQGLLGAIGLGRRSQLSHRYFTHH